jgi:hypothetical protein
MPPDAAIFQLMFGKHLAYCLSAVARLGVADRMSQSPETVEELAQSIGAHVPSLYRVMRTLASVGVFTEHPDNRFSLTRTGELLKTDAPGSLRYLAMFMGGEIATRAFAHLTDCVRTGVSGVRAEFGKDAFDLFATFPVEAETFHRAMVNFSAVVGPAIVEAYDFSGLDRIADVGGGHGMLLATILKHHPGMRGVLYDLPDVVAGAQASGCLAGVEERVEIDAGSFLERAPAGCDAYVLKHIIHDWSDETCTRILRCVREQLPAHGRVLLCEMVVPDDPGPAPAKLLDIEMLVITLGGRERTAAEFAELFASAGLRLERVVPTKSPVCVLEARLA